MPCRPEETSNDAVDIPLDFEMTAALLQPDHLRIVAPDGSQQVGFDQDWYRLLWRRRAGCGPTTAANLFTYLHRAGALILPDAFDPSSPEELLDFYWEYVTPTMWGLNSTALFRDGADRLLDSIGSRLRSQVLDVDKDAALRPTPAQAAAFIKAGLDADSPVAFLNLSNGQVAHLDSWHWVTILAMEQAGETVTLHVLDNTQRFDVDLPLWLRTTTRGGGFVYLANPAQAAG